MRRVKNVSVPLGKRGAEICYAARLPRPCVRGAALTSCSFSRRAPGKGRGGGGWMDGWLYGWMDGWVGVCVGE